MAGRSPDIESSAHSPFERGNELARRGDLSGAEEAYRHADEQGHGTAAAYVGIFSESHGQLGEAEQAYRRADERGDGYGAFRLGLLLSHANDWDGATQAWQRAEDRGYAKPPFDPVALIRRQPSADGAATLATPSEVQRSAFANPVLIGAVTTLIAIIAVFLAYNANNGLPFVPTRELKVDIANGAALVPGNDVDEGAFRVGLVSDMRPVILRDGHIGAQLTLKLSKSAGGVPIDSSASVVPRSVLGLKYLELTRGHSKRMFPDGGQIPLSHTTVPVQFDDINTMFDAKTRPAVKQDLAGFGDVLAARGSSLNDTIASLPALFGHLRPVAAYLSDPRTELSRFFQALNGFMGTVSPVAQANVRLFADQATTFAAIDKSPADLEATIRESPPTLDVSTASLKVQQPFLVDLTTFSKYMQPATSALRQALPQINPALVAGVRVLPRTPHMNKNLDAVLQQLKTTALDPGTNVALNALTATTGTLNPMLRYLGPYVTVCNGWNYFWAELQDLVSEQTQFGMAQRALANFANHQTNNVNSQGATAPANGYQPGDLPDQSLGADAEFLHAPNYSAAVDAKGNADCEVGQRGYQLRQNSLDPQHRNLGLDAHTPGDQGTVWNGLAHVPQGETFSRNPSFGPQLPVIASNQ